MSGVTRVATPFRRFVCRHRTLTGLPVLALALYVLTYTAVEAGLLSGLLIMLYLWCLMLEASDLPGTPLRQNRRLLQTGILAGAIGAMSAIMYFVAAHFEQRG